jgi:putative methylase
MLSRHVQLVKVFDCWVSRMKKKELELFLENVEGFTSPKPWFEQYKTPASIAADLLFLAYGFHDIQGKRVIDLGCGTGIFSIGAAMLHADQVIGVDVDKESIKQAEHFASNHHLDIEFRCADVSTISDQVDTVVMNPPFGAQKKNLHADRIFIEKATSIADVTYSLHLDHTLSFIEKLLHTLDKKGIVLKTYQFPLPAQFAFHTKLKDTVTVALLRIISNTS